MMDTETTLDTQDVPETIFWGGSIGVGLLLGMWIQYIGLSATPDSIAYMDAAIAFQDFTINLEVFWGPFYPMMLAIFSLFALPAEAACYINGIAFTLMVTGTLRLARAFDMSRLGLLLLAPIPLVWSDLWHVHRVIWSGGTFLALTVLHFFYLLKYIRRPALSSWFLLSLMAALALLTRYVGYFFLPHIGILLLMHRQKDRFLHKFGLSTLAYLPHLWWLFTNFQRSGTLHGSRGESQYTLQDNLQIFWQESSDVLFAGGGVCVFAIVGLIALVNPKNRFATKKQDTWWLLALCSSIVIFSSLLLYSATSVSIDRINARLTAPLYPMVLLLSIFGVTKATTFIRTKYSHPLTVGTMLVLTVITQSLSSPERNSQKWIQMAKKRGEYSNVPFLGFTKSKTRALLGDTLRSEIDKHEHVKVLWLEGQKFNNYFKLALFRDIIPSDSIELGTIVSEQTFIEAPLFTASGLKTISIHNTGEVKSIADLKRRMERLHTQIQYRDLLIVGRKSFLKRLQATEFSWTLSTDKESQEITCAPLHYPTLYTILECTTTPSSTTVATPVEPSSGNTNPVPSTKQTIDSPHTLQEYKSLYISEVMAFPTKSKKWRGEWFEIYNAGDIPLNLRGLEFHSKGQTGLVIEQDATIQPKSHFLFAMRNDPAVNGGLPTADIEFLTTNISIHPNDWLEIRFNNQPVDRFNIAQEWLKQGISVQRDRSGDLCFATTPYGDGDLGSPKVNNACP